MNQLLSRRMKLRILGASSAIAVVSALALASLVGAGRATPGSGLTVEMFGKGVASDTLKLDLKGTVPAKRARAWRGTYGSPWDVTAMRVTFAPGAHSGWHRHPGPGIVVVTKGAVTFYSDDCTPKTYTEGQSFIEIPGVTNMVRNDTQGTAQFVATFVNPATAPLRIDVPAAPCSP